jgi:hypothetical protein
LEFANDDHFFAGVTGIHTSERQADTNKTKTGTEPPPKLENLRTAFIVQPNQAKHRANRVWKSKGGCKFRDKNNNPFQPTKL